MSKKLTPQQLKSFEKHLQAAFPHLGITVTPYPNMEWKIDMRDASEADIEQIKESATTWYIKNKGATPAFGKFRHVE